jgi:hypothetical protein
MPTTLAWVSHDCEFNAPGCALSAIARSRRNQAPAEHSEPEPAYLNLSVDDNRLFKIREQ